MGVKDSWIIGTIYYYDVETLSENTSRNQTITSIHWIHLSSTDNGASGDFICSFWSLYEDVKVFWEVTQHK